MRAKQIVEKVIEWAKHKAIELNVGGIGGTITTITIDWPRIAEKVQDALIVLVINCGLGTIISLLVGFFVKKWLKKNFPNEFKNG